MSDEEKTAIRQLIYRTIDRLQLAGVSPKHMGQRYARLLRLLWGKSEPKTPRQATRRDPPGAMSSALGSQSQNPTAGSSGVGGTSNGAFSWLDLDAVRNFAMYDSISDLAPAESTEAAMESETSPFHVNFLTDYRCVDDNNPNLMF